MHGALGLAVVFLLASGGGYLVVRGAVNATVEHQALIVAEVVAAQAATSRSVYAREVAAKAAEAAHAAASAPRLPIPAQFLKMVGRASSERADRLYEYRPVSRWNLEPTQGLSDDFLRWAWPQLQAQDQAAPRGPIGWRAVSRIDTEDGRRVLRYLSADPAAQASCVNCHNALERTPLVMAQRLRDGVEPGKQWAQHQLLGALSVTIPLDKAEAVAGGQINRTASLVAGILVASFAALLWFNWRLTRQQRSLRDAALQLRSAELEAEAANQRLEARRGIERAFAELSGYMRAIDQHAMVLVSDADDRLVSVNDRLLESSGHSRQALQGAAAATLFADEAGAPDLAALRRQLGPGEVWRGTRACRRSNGDLYWVDAAVVPMHDEQGRVERLVSIHVDVTERLRSEQEMRRLATHDHLTGLVNRTLLRDRIHQALERDRREGAQAAVLFIDLDQFKHINDSLGHAVGDCVLVETAARLRGSVRAEDTVARQGGDEFIVFMPRVQSVDDVRAMAGRLQARLAEPIDAGGHRVRVGSSIGVALFPHDGEDADTLLRHSDAAMYQVKEAGRNHFMLFDRRMDEEAARRYQLSGELRGAAERGELELHYQPVMGVASGRLEGLEALLRWRHPRLGMVPPAQFIPLAEASGQIVAIGEWVFETACSQIGAWRAAGLQPPRVAINLSALQVRHPELVTRLRGLLLAAGLEASALELELTEGSLLGNTAEVMATLQGLHALGLHMSIDDFGTGYSSLGYLKRLPIASLKIDRSFVTDIEGDGDDAAIVAAVISMARSLRLRVVAEGVETPGQLQLLRTLGCDQYQGFLASPALPPAALRPWLAAVQHDPAPA